MREYSKIKYYSIIAFTTKADLKVNTTTDVIYTVKLLKTIKRYKEEVLNEKDKNEIYSKLINLNVDSKENRKEHVEAIRNERANYIDKINHNICTKCGGKLVLRKGKYGEFKGCSNYPKCRYIYKP